MKFNCCSSCIWYQRKLLTEHDNIPFSCNRPELADIFGCSVGGFPTGIDIVHCAYHTMYSPWTGDVTLIDENGRQVSYVLTKERDFKHIRIPKLYDNSKNIKVRRYESKRSKGQIEECPY